MPIVTYQVSTTGNNDGYISGTSTFNRTANQVIIGNSSGASSSAFFRFTGVEIPQGATINSAKLQYYAQFSRSGTTCSTLIHFNDADNATAPTSYAEYTGKAVTSSVAWEMAAQTAGSWYDSPDISTLVQAIVNRTGWASGNAMMVLHKNNSSTSGAYRQPACFEVNSGTTAAKLIIEYTIPGTLVTLTSSTGLDDGIAVSIFDTSDILAVGDLGATVDTFIRFPNVEIPQGATINYAVLRYVPDNSEVGMVCNSRIYLNSVDNAVAPIDNTTYNTKTTTTAYVDWTIPSTTAGIAIESPNIKAVIQEIINRSGWVSGNALMVLHKNNASTANAYRTFHSIDTSLASKPQLIIYYNYDGGGGTEYPKTLTVYVDMGSSMLHIVNKKNTANVDSSSVVLHQIGKRATGNIKSFGSFLHGILKKLSAISKTSGSISKHSTFVKIVSTISNMTNNLLHSNGKSLNATSHIYNTVLHYNEKFLDGAVGVGFSIWYSIGKSLISAFDLRSVITRLTGKRLLNISISSGTNKKDSSKRISSNNAVLGTILKSSSKKLLVIIDSLGSFLVQLVTGTQQYLKNLSTNIYTSYFIKKQSDKIPVSLINSSNVLTKSTNKNLLTTAILSVNFFIQSIKIFVKNLAASLTTNNYTQKNTYKANVTEVNINPISKKDTNKKIDTNVGLINLVVKSIIKSFVAGIGLVGRIITNKYQRGNVKIIASIKRHIRVDLVVVARRVDIYSFPRKVDLTFTPRKIEMSTKSRRIDMRIL